MTPRRAVLRLLAPVAAGFALALAPAGCADEAKETGTTVEMTPEDIKGFEAAEESYKNMGKPEAKPKSD